MIAQLTQQLKASNIKLQALDTMKCHPNQTAAWVMHQIQSNSSFIAHVYIIYIANQTNFSQYTEPRQTYLQAAQTKTKII